MNVYLLLAVEAAQKANDEAQHVLTDASRASSALAQTYALIAVVEELRELNRQIGGISAYGIST